LKARRFTTGCRDTRSRAHCEHWSSQGYCQSSSYASFMASNCPATCGSCSGGSSSPSPAPTQRPSPSPAPSRSPSPSAGCRDSGRHCASWASQGYCQSATYASYMESNCPETCGACSGGGSSSSGGTSPSPAPTQSRTPAPAPASGGGPSSATLRAVLDQHNLYRCMHGVNALTWDDTIAANAQQWARSTGGRMRHSTYEARQGVAGFGNVGENLASGVTDAGAVDMWYNEVRFTNGGLQNAYSSQTGHYTQVVWRDTSRLGCGIQGTLLVCQYGAGGNMRGGFQRNVLAPSRTREECSGSR